MFIAETNIFENILILPTEMDVLSKLNRKGKRYLRFSNSNFTSSGEEANTIKFAYEGTVKTVAEKIFV